MSSLLRSLAAPASRRSGSARVAERRQRSSSAQGTRAVSLPAITAAKRSTRTGSSRAERLKASSTAAASDPALLDLPECEVDDRGVERVALKEEGWKRWEWRGHRCHYISAGEQNTGPVVVLVHGFGAHSYHWRYTIPALARNGCRVYALCMLGYGWSPKVEEEFSMELWGQQVIDFSSEVAGASESDKAFIAGNSIGALAAMYAATEGNHLFRGLCLVNSAGNFASDAAPGAEKKTAAQKLVGKAPDPAEERTPAMLLREWAGRTAATAIFYFTKVRIKQILQQVYDNEVDADLVRSIDLAAEDPGALGTFYQLSLAGGRTKAKPRDLLERFNGDVMLLWGEKDPWMTPTKAGLIMDIRPDAQYAPILAGHCPQDDAPTEANKALLSWIASSSSST